MNLFDILPERFFSVLASPLRRHYAEVLFRIYDKYRHITLGIPREAVVQETMNYLSQVQSEQLQHDLAEEEISIHENPRVTAGAFLRKLEAAGWIHVEMSTRFEEFVNLSDHAIQILDVLAAIRDQRPLEYEGYVYATYRVLDGARGPRRAENGAMAIRQAHEHTERLVRNLKLLNHNIRRYIQRLVEQSRPRDVLELTLDGYKQEILDRSYLQLKTSDNVSRYRPRILRYVNEWLAHPEWLRQAALVQVGAGREDEAEALVAQMREALAFIRESYQEVDALLDEIDRKNSRYIAVAVNHIHVMLNSAQDSEGQLTRLVRFLGEQLASEESRKDDLLPPEMESLFSLYPQAFLDVHSLQTPRRMARRHRPETVAVQVDRARRDRARQRFAERAARRLSRQKVYAYVEQVMGERQEARAADFPLRNLREFIFLIAVGLYGGERSAPYAVEWKNGEVEAGAFHFPEMVVRRKEARTDERDGRPERHRRGRRPGARAGLRRVD